MAVTACREMLESRTGNHQLNLPRIDRTYTRVYQVETNDDDDDAAVVLAYGSLPAILASYPTDPYALVASRNAVKEAGNPYVWKVTINYQSHFDFDPATASENPLLRPPQIKYSWEKQERFDRIDLDDEPIVNTAGTPIDPPLSTAYGIQIIEVTINVATLPFASVLDVCDTTNDSSYVVNGITYPQYTLLLAGVTSSYHFENNVNYYEVTYTLKFRPLERDGWLYTYVLSQGYYELNEDDEPVLIRDKYGNPLPAPSMLDEDGVLTDEPYYIPFRLRNAISFSTLIG